MKPVDELVKSLRRDQVIAGLCAAGLFFFAAGLGLAAELRIHNISLKQIAPLWYFMGLIGLGQSFLAYRVMRAAESFAVQPAMRRPK